MPCMLQLGEIITSFLDKSDCLQIIFLNRLWVKSAKSAYQEIFVEWKTDGNLVGRVNVMDMATCVIRYE